MLNGFIKKEAGILSPMDMKKGAARTAYWIIILILLFMSLCAFIPILWIVFSGFKEAKEFAGMSPSFFPKSIDLSKIGYVWRKASFAKYYINSFVLAAGSIVVCVASTGLIGYALSKMRARGMKLIFTLIMWTMLLPGSVSMVPLFMTFVDFPLLHVNLTNSFLPIWLMAGTNAFNMLLFKSFFDSIDMAYVEAAKIDGCSTLGIFTKIMLPLSIPVVTVVSIFCFNSAWENFLWPYIVIKNEALKPVAVAIYDLNKAGLSVDEYMIVLLLSIVPPIAVFAVSHKQIMEGINVGGIKG